MLRPSNIFFKVQACIWKHIHMYNNGDTARINSCAQWETQNRTLPSVIENNGGLFLEAKKTQRSKNICQQLCNKTWSQIVCLWGKLGLQIQLFSDWRWPHDPEEPNQLTRPPKSYMMIHKHRLTSTSLRSEMTCNCQVWLEYEEIRRTSG